MSCFLTSSTSSSTVKSVSAYFLQGFLSWHVVHTRTVQNNLPISNSRCDQMTPTNPFCHIRQYSKAARIRTWICLGSILQPTTVHPLAPKDSQPSTMQNPFTPIPTYLKVSIHSRINWKSLGLSRTISIRLSSHLQNAFTATPRLLFD